MANNIDCSNVSIEPIRARVIINSYVVETPYVKSFNVTKSRNSNVGTFSCTLEIPINANIGTTSGTVEIYAGTKQNYLNRRVFTGVIRQVVPNPAPGKPNYMLLTISGRDIMYKLENKKFSRRIKSSGPGVFCVIDGIKGNRPTAGWATDKRIRSGQNTYTAASPALYDRKEHNDLTKAYDYSKTGTDWTGAATQIVPEPGRAGAAGLSVHTHKDMNNGGPAFGVYGIS